MYRTTATKHSFTLLAIVITCGLLTGCNDNAEETQVSSPRPIKIFNVGEHINSNIRIFPATVFASKQSEISFQIPGKLIDLPIIQSQIVKQGQLLAKIDDRDYRAERDLRLAESELASSNFQRLKILQQKGMVSEAEFDNARAQLKANRAALQLAMNKVADSTITAPFSGRIAQIATEKHQYLQPQQPVLLLQDNTALDISIQLPESVLGQINQANIDKSYQPRVSFFGDHSISYPVSYKEHATNVTPGTLAYNVIFSLVTPAGLTVYPGMAATVNIDFDKLIQGNQDPQTIVVPLTAVHENDSNGQQQVWVYDPLTQLIVPTEVTLGAIRQTGIEIRSGLNGNELIAASGTNQLHLGIKVKPLAHERGL